MNVTCRVEASVCPCEHLIYDHCRTRSLLKKRVICPDILNHALTITGLARVAGARAKAQLPVVVVDCLTDEDEVRCANAGATDGNYHGSLRLGLETLCDSALLV